MVVVRWCLGRRGERRVAAGDASGGGCDGRGGSGSGQSHNQHHHSNHFAYPLPPQVKRRANDELRIIVACFFKTATSVVDTDHIWVTYFCT